MNNIKTIPSYVCTGCGACENSCPQQCIHFQLDSEGFWVPTINFDLCIDCGICLANCPACNDGLSRSKVPVTKEAEIYAAWNKSQDILARSTSGGIFPALAEEVIRQKGIIVGAAWQDDMTVRHIAVDKEAAIAKLQGSKYLQSRVGDMYSTVERLLREDRLVLFSGLPCQIAGLNSYIEHQKNPNRVNLITCQLVCYGVPSDSVFRKYISHIENRYGSPIKSYCFRDKKVGWRTYGVRAIFENERQYSSKGENDPFMIGFQKALYFRSSCYQCRYKGFPICADIALGDFWHVNECDNSLAGIDGISLVVIQTEKGGNLFNSIKDRLVSKQQTLETAISCNPSLVSCARLKSDRKKFFYDIDAHGYEYCVRKYTQRSTFLRRILVNLNGRLRKWIK